MNVKIYCFLLCAFGMKMTWAQNSTLLMGARAMGMGNASSTLADEWSLLNNIAGLGKITQSSTAFAYEVRPALTGANQMAASLMIPAKIGALGLAAFRFGDDLYSEQMLSFGLGNEIGNTSLGAKINYIQYRAEGFGVTTAVSADLGGITRITPQISIGAYITNLTRSKLTGTEGQQVPSRLVTGAGFRPSDKIFLATELEKDLDYLATWRNGLEYSIHKKIFFRTGFSVNPATAYAGLGIQKKNLKFDYAMRFSQFVGTAHQASAIYLISTKSVR
jgi:hypothetical protein